MPKIRSLEKSEQLPSTVCHIFCRMRSKNIMKIQIAVVDMDTGAPISLVPPKIWKKCDIEIVGETELLGVIPKRECVMHHRGERRVYAEL